MINRITVIEQAIANTFDEQEQEHADIVAAEVYAEWIRDGSMDVEEVHEAFYDPDGEEAMNASIEAHDKSAGPGW